MRTYKGSTILVTGASRGIGAAIARQLIDPSVRLLLTARNEEKLQALAHEIEAHGGHSAIFPHDLGVPGAASTLYAQITEQGYAPDVLINNAGFGSHSAFAEHDLDDFSSMVTLNVTNLMALTHRCLPHMRAQGRGGVLNVASTAAYTPIPFMAVYGATKSFVLSFSQALHAEVKPDGVTVTCLCPGPTDTSFFDRAQFDRTQVEGSVLGAAGFETPEYVAKVGLQALLAGHMSVVAGTSNRVAVAAGRVLPTRALVSVLRRILAPND
ncbi:MAG: SDR family oxidoreductase [Bacteroidota bacterium]